MGSDRRLALAPQAGARSGNAQWASPSSATHWPMRTSASSTGADVLTGSKPSQRLCWWRCCREGVQAQPGWLRSAGHEKSLGLIRSHEPDGSAVIRAAGAASWCAGPWPRTSRQLLIAHRPGGTDALGPHGRTAGCWTPGSGGAAGHAGAGREDGFLRLCTAWARASPALSDRLRTLLACLDNPSPGSGAVDGRDIRDAAAQARGRCSCWLASRWFSGSGVVVRMADRPRSRVSQERWNCVPSPPVPRPFPPSGRDADSARRPAFQDGARARLEIRRRPPSWRPVRPVAPRLGRRRRRLSHRRGVAGGGVRRRAAQATQAPRLRPGRARPHPGFLRGPEAAMRHHRCSFPAAPFVIPPRIPRDQRTVARRGWSPGRQVPGGQGKPPEARRAGRQSCRLRAARHGGRSLG